MDTPMAPDPVIWPTVTIAVPCFNEEKTVGKTLESLMALEYPKDKLRILVIDDGSTDGTIHAAHRYASPGFIEILTKTNGGKHTAVNHALAMTSSEYFGCLDADSYVEPMTLKYIIRTFLTDDETMAVTPTMCVHEPKGFVQQAQRFEYLLGVFVKQIMSILGAIHVAPGPFSIFKTEVFSKIGNFKPAHKTEDMEIAFRMQSKRMKIVNSRYAKVHTTTPNTIKKLFVQRTRWTYGFLRNAYDYRFLFFKKHYGNIGIITLPFAFLSIATTLYVIIITVQSLFFVAWQYIERLFLFGFHVPRIDGIDNFYINLQAATIIAMGVFLFNFVLLCLGQKMGEGRIKLSLDIIWYYLLFTLIAPWWLGKAVYRAVRLREVTWR